MQPPVSLRKPILGVLVALWPVLWLARAREVDALTRWLIPAFVVLVLASVLAWGASPAPGAARWMKAAFGLVAVGDLFLNVTPWPAGAAPAFVGAHGCFAVAFLRERSFTKPDLPLVLPPAVVTIAFGCFEVSSVSGAARAAVLGVYLAALCMMLWRALCTRGGGRAGARIGGATLFFATDLLAIATAVHGTRAFIPWIWALYPPALICLAWSSWRPAPDRVFDPRAGRSL